MGICIVDSVSLYRNILVVAILIIRQLSVDRYEFLILIILTFLLLCLLQFSFFKFFPYDLLVLAMMDNRVVFSFDSICLQLYCIHLYLLFPLSEYLFIYQKRACTFRYVCIYGQFPMLSVSFCSFADIICCVFFGLSILI